MSPITNILCPVDFSAASDAAAKHAAELASQLGAKLSLLHVLNEPLWMLPEGSTIMSPILLDEYEAGAKKRVQELASRLPGDPNTSVVRGVPYLEIIKAATAQGASMIVMGTHGRSGLPHVLLGSVAERVLRLSPVPVMTLRVPA